MRLAELVARGTPAPEAQERAHAFGDLERTRKYCRNVDSRGERAMRLADRVDEWRQDVRYALRTMRRSPRFAVASLITLALAIRDIKPLDVVIGSSLGARRFSLGLAASFAVVALILAGVGVYGVLAYSLTFRTKEFGVRLALGATARAVILLVVRERMTWAVAGLALGLVGAIAAARLIAGLLFGVTPLDSSTFVFVASSLLVVAATACLVPALRATRVDPLTSIQSE